MTLYLNPVTPWSDAGRTALAARYGADEDGRARVSFCDYVWWRSTPFDAALVDLDARFKRHASMGDRDHNSPALESAVTLLGVSESAVHLCAQMSDISEAGICAGWESGLENSLWRYVESDDVPHPFAGLMDHDDGDRALLRRLRDEGGVWWVFDDLGNRAVPIEEFRAAFAEHGAWPEVRHRVTVANILEDGWDRGLHACGTCPCADCRAKRGVR